MGLPAHQRHAGARPGAAGQPRRRWRRCCTRRATRWRKCRRGRIPDKVRFFERAKPNQLWQTDLFTFVLKRQNRRVYLVAFMDDHSRFIVSYGLHASQSSALVLEVLRAAIDRLRDARGDPDRQRLAVRDLAGQERVHARSWRNAASGRWWPRRGGRRRWGRSNASGERCGGSASRRAVFIDLGDAQRRIGLFIDHYNFQRPHQGIEGLVPADRFFGAAPEVLRTLQARVAANALELARNGVPKTPFYLTGQVGGQPFSVHAEGERVILTGPEGRRKWTWRRRRGRRPQGCPFRCAHRRSSPTTGGDMPTPRPPPGTSRWTMIWADAGKG